MSGKGKKSGRKNKTLGDVTLNDFANAKTCKNRTKKSANSMTHVIKQLEEDDDRSWEEKTEDFEGDFDFVEQENDDGTTSMVLKRRSTSRRRRKTLSECDGTSKRDGIEYPLDIWFLISEYVNPEDVRRFSGICRSTYTVVCSAKFWFCLYKRFYKNAHNLPERLQPECMVRKYGLKACVIRALHFMYPPFVSRIKAVTTFEEHPHNLLKRQCVLMWHAKCKDKWLYYFKLKENVDFIVGRSTNVRRHQQQPDLIEMLDDVLANTEEGCRILQVSCPHFVPTPLVLGLTLTSVALTLSQGLRHHRLQMGFGSGLSYTSRPVDCSGCVEIVLDPVINVRVLDWWHPLYPHSQTTPVLNQSEISN